MMEGQEELQQKKPFVLHVFALLVFHFEDFFEPWVKLRDEHALLMMIFGVVVVVLVGMNFPLDQILHQKNYWNIFLENFLWLLWTNLISDSVDESYSTIIFFEFWDREDEDFVFLWSSFEELRCW